MALFERTITILLLLPLCAAFAGEDGLAEAVRRQGEEIERLKDEVSSLKGHDRVRLEQDIKAYLEDTSDAVRPTDTRNASFGQRVRVGGYFSLEYRDDGDGNSSFDAHRLVLKFASEVANAITFETEIEIEGGGADVGFLSGNEVLVEYAELRFQLIEDTLVFKVGLILIPWGRFNRVHDDPINDLTDRPLVARRLAAVAFDQPGLGAEGTVELGGGWFLDYDVALVQGFGDGITTSGGLRDARQSFRSDNNNNKQVFGRVVVSPPVNFVDVLDIGFSGTWGKYDDAGMNEMHGYGIDLFVKKGPFEFAGEYMTVGIEQAIGAPASEPRRMSGWYVQIAFHFFPESWRGSHDLFTDESTFTFVVRIEQIDLNHATNGSTLLDDLTQVTIGFNFRPVERTVFKISFAFVDSEVVGVVSGSADKFVISWATFF